MKRTVKGEESKVASARILIEGEKVQGVGYRIFLTQKILETGIEKALPRNVDADKVEVLVEDKEFKIDRFFKIVKEEKPKDAVVKSVRREPYEDEIPIPTIDRYLSYLAAEQLVQGRREIVELPDRVAERLPLKGIEEALVGIDRKMDAATDRFGVIGDYMKEMSERLNALPGRIAEAITKGSRKKPRR
jgi:acylphosphatase